MSTASPLSAVSWLPLRWRPAVGGLLWVVLALIQYGNTLGHDFAWDDELVIVRNPRTLQGLTGIPEHFAFGPRVEQTDFTGYRPVTLSSFSLDVQLNWWTGQGSASQPDGIGPGISHFFNVVYFGLLCAVLFALLRRLMGRWHWLWPLLITLLFLVHPLHVEAVANIKSRDEILALLFGLLAWGQYLRFEESGHWKWLLSTLALVALSALSKESGLLFVGLIPLSTFVLTDKTGVARWKTLLGLPVLGLGLLVLFLLLTGQAPGSSSTVATEGVLENTMMGNSFAVPATLWERIGNGFRLLVLYLGKFFWPEDLVYFSGYNQIPFYDWNGTKLAIPFMGVSLTMLAALFMAVTRRHKWMAWAACWFFFSSLLYLQIALLLADAMADRFMMTPSVGLCVLLVVGLGKLLRFSMEENPFERPLQPKYLVGLSIICISILAFGWRTMDRNTVWKDNLTLFQADIDQLENCSRAHYYLANALMEVYPEYPQAQQARLRQDILAHLEKAIAITDSAYYAYLDLGGNQMRWEDWQGAEKTFRRAVDIWPQRPDPQFYLGKILYLRGAAEEAVGYLRKSVEMQPELDENWELLGRAMSRAGYYEGAEQILAEAIKKSPGNPMLYDARADMFWDHGQYAQAFEEMNNLIKLQPDNPVWYRKMITAQNLKGDPEIAGLFYEEAMRRGLQLE